MDLAALQLHDLPLGLFALPQESVTHGCKFIHTSSLHRWCPCGDHVQRWVPNSLSDRLPVCHRVRS